MFKLEYGKSYLWLFPVFVVVFFGTIAVCRAFGHFPWAAIALPLFMVVLLSCELRSKVVLDSWWRASYRPGDWQYRALLAWQFFGLLLFIGMSIFVISVIR